MSSTERIDDSPVSLIVPGRPEFLRLVRLAAADCGVRADFSVEDVEDLRIAVDELAYALIGDEPSNNTVTLTYSASPGVVEIEGSCASGDQPVVVSELSESIICAVVDEHDVVDENGVRRFHLVKRRRA